VSSPTAPSAAALVERLLARGTTVSHFVGHLTYGDAVSFDAVNKWQALRRLGVPGELYCGVPDEHHHKLARPLSAHRPAADELVVLHYAVWSETAAYVRALRGRPVLFVYHNITPTRWFEGVHRQAEEDTRLGRERLPDFVAQSRHAVAMSEYSRQELEAVGFASTGVVPLMIEFGYLDRPARTLQERLADGYTNLLSVSRLAPNKCHEDTIKIFYHYKRQIEPRSRLILVGAPTVGAYKVWLERLVKRLGLDPHVVFAGHVSDAELAAYHRAADVLVSMSEHEGFGASLLASMYVGVPVVAFDATAVPYVVGDAAVLVERKNHAVAAEALALLLEPASRLRARMIAKGRERVEQFLPERVGDRLVGAIARALDLAPTPLHPPDAGTPGPHHPI
jgi:glycosyltransferase involved in cell wall biosynthesis